MIYFSYKIGVIFPNNVNKTNFIISTEKKSFIT